LAAQRYLIALGSNMRHVRHGKPEQVLRAAVRQLPGKIEAVAPWIASAPLGPSRRRYANGAALVCTPLLPDDMLEALQEIERAFGRRSGGQRWSSRVLDLDIVLWSGGAWASPGLVVPHRAFRERHFVLDPANAIAPGWRDPVTGLTIRQLFARAKRAVPDR
jgi:2-amino-4-hydroxy-6-hydroxymethyldihydropteridine diphosphokinase